ncbi:MAG: type II toxin-antitoxin system RelE/ParE family toxin [Acidobacteria bacterium]|nr:type II toxin-antitoxin system RelE/ParE family toxin [Acidobacteriota bacterium]
MKRVILSPEAEDDLMAIGDYLMQHSPAAAVRTMKMLRQSIDLLPSFPSLGIARDDLLLGLRCLIVKQYLIFYQPSDDLLEIMHVRHSSQSQDNLFPF